MEIMKMEKEIKKRNIIILVLLTILIYVLNCEITYPVECENGQSFISSQKIIYYIIGLD
jgi:hypothetical protein